MVSISMARFLPKVWEVIFVREALKAVAKLDCGGELLNFLPWPEVAQT